MDNSSFNNEENDKNKITDEFDGIFDDFDSSNEISDGVFEENNAIEQNEAIDVEAFEVNENSQNDFEGLNDNSNILQEDEEEKIEQEQTPEELISVRPVKFQEFDEEVQNRAIKKNLDILQDISMHVSVELGRTQSSIKEVMDMKEGSIVELDKIAGEQVEIYVNGKIVAKGEVIVIEDKFGVRVTSTNLPKPDAVV